LKLKTRLLPKVGDPAEMEFSGQDLVDIVESIVGKSGFFNWRKPEAPGQTLVAALTAALSGEKSLFNYRLIYYLAALVEGKYVDRSGTLYEKPKISASLGNDTIIPFVMVVLDSFLDCFSQVPVFYAAAPGSSTLEKTWKPIVGKEPTFAKFEFQGTWLKARCTTSSAARMAIICSSRNFWSSPTRPSRRLKM
jgi:hypothetical protein